MAVVAANRPKRFVMTFSWMGMLQTRRRPLGRPKCFGASLPCHRRGEIRYAVAWVSTQARGHADVIGGGRTDWRISLSANRCPLRRDMRYRARCAVTSI